MNIKLGDKGDGVKRAQRQLNRLGTLLEEDGIFGKDCVAAVATCCKKMKIAPGVSYTDEMDLWLSAQPDLLPTVDASAVTFIAREEVGSLAYYAAKGAAPCYPGGESGITIGVGYDLRAKVQSFSRDWLSYLPIKDAAALQAVLGKKGTPALVSGLCNIQIPWEVAWQVFTQSTLPQTLLEVQGAFPGQERLSPLSRGALLSLVYNRGPALDGDRRTEMRAIHDAIAAARYQDVAPQFLAMRRLWPTVPGLCQRREREADMFTRGLN